MQFVAFRDSSCLKHMHIVVYLQLVQQDKFCSRFRISSSSHRFRFWINDSFQEDDRGDGADARIWGQSFAHSIWMPLQWCNSSPMILRLSLNNFLPELILWFTYTPLVDRAHPLQNTDWTVVVCFGKDNIFSGALIGFGSESCRFRKKKLGQEAWSFVFIFLQMHQPVWLNGSDYPLWSMARLLFRAKILNDSNPISGEKQNWRSDSRTHALVSTMWGGRGGGCVLREEAKKTTKNDCEWVCWQNDTTQPFENGNITIISHC